jgi:hypothetical protein
MTAPLSRLGFLSPESQCFSFDDRANGYSRGEGVGMAVLKRLSRATQDGDTIRAVIRSSATNQVSPICCMIVISGVTHPLEAQLTEPVLKGWPHPLYLSTEQHCPSRHDSNCVRGCGA